MSPGVCSFPLRREKVVTITILLQTLSITFASLNEALGKTDSCGPKKPAQCGMQQMLWAEHPGAREDFGWGNWSWPLM